MDELLYKLRHSSAHIMAQAVLEVFPGAKPTIGPPIKDGFYYDFYLDTPIQEKDLLRIEERMKEIIKGNFDFKYSEISEKEAFELFGKNEFKKELIEGLVKGGQDEYGNQIDTGTKTVISIYQQDTFIDLCKGPHVRNTSEIEPEAIKLMKVAGAYWRGDEKKPMLQRIYGTAWASKQELDKYLNKIEEAEKRDHRKIGKELELFHIDPTAPGMPYWLPNGLILLNELLAFWREEHSMMDYHEIASPLINEKKLWEVSGHWEHYKDNMFIIPVDENTTYGVKPMNCPNAMVVYNLKTRSYKDLPLRLSDCDILHRMERSGTLHGLLRVQHIQQDDAHIFVTEDQIEQEYENILQLVERFYKIFNLKYKFRLGTRPHEGFIGDIETWNRAEDALKRILDKHVGKGNYIIEDGDGAFYGPKIDILIDDALERSWQMGTLQLDFQLPQRFECYYIDSKGEKVHPIVIHRVIYGSLERFIGILIEHTAGKFPTWISPKQVCIINISDDQIDYCKEVHDLLRKQKIRSSMNLSAERMNAKIRLAQTQKIPYMLIIGKKEKEERTVSVRLRDQRNLGTMSIEAFLELIQTDIAEKRILESYVDAE